MPHSPRMHDGQLWLLNAGAGELGVVVRDGDGKGRFEPRVFCPGFLRGLALHGGLAFVGLSKPRYKRFEGLPLEARLAKTDSSPWCGVQVIDLATGTCVDWFRIDGPVAELYDLAVIPGFVCPMAISPGSPEAAALITHADRTWDLTTTTPMELTCYLHPAWKPLIRPAGVKRDWMEAATEAFPHRCLPLNIANAHGWEIATPCGAEASWNGGPLPEDVTVAVDDGADPITAPVAIFGQGVLTFHVMGIFRTPPGWNLYVGGPPNQPKDGIAPVERHRRDRLVAVHLHHELAVHPSRS